MQFDQRRSLRHPTRRTVTTRTPHPSCRPVAQPRGPHGSLERRALEDRDVRLARLRRRRLRPRRHGRHEDHRRRARPGRASPAAWTGSSTPGFKQPAGESVLIQSRSLRVGAPAFDAAVADVVAGDLEARGRPERPLAARIRQRGPDRQERARRARRVRDPRRQGQGGRQDRPGPRPRGRSCRRPTRASSSASSATRARQKRVDTAYGDDLGKAGLLSLPVTLIILVVAFGALVAAGIPLLLALTAVFATFGLISLPSHRPPGRDGGARAGAPDRARRRRRLLDVLLEARARGAGRRKQRAGGARGRRRDFRPLGAHLGADGDRRDGGHVPDRRPDLRVARRRDDPRGRRRSARLADRASGAALAARRQGRPRARPARRAPQPRRRRGPDLGRDRRPRPAPAARSRPPSPAGCCWRSPSRAAAAPRRAGARLVPEVTRGHQDVRPDAAGVPRHGAARPTSS